MHRSGVQLRTLLCVTMLCLSALGASAQDLVRFEHISVDEGLTQNEVSAALQDSMGFLWIGTPDGLNRYDGYEFAVFQFDPTDPTSISDNRITSLLETSNGTLWVGTADGLNRYDPEMVAFTAYRSERRDEASLLSNRVSALQEDAAGRMWIGHADPDDPSVGGVSILDPHSGQIDRYPLSAEGDEAVPVYALAIGQDGVMWVGTAAGLYRWDQSNNSFSLLQHDPNDPNSLAGNDVRELLLDADGQLWIGFWGQGLDCYNPISGEVQHHEPGPTGVELTSGYITAIAQTRDGLLWVGTANPDGAQSASLHRYDFKTFARFAHDPNIATTLGSGTVRAIVEDHAHVLWVGTDLGGLSLFDQITKPIPHFFPIDGVPSGLSSPIVTSFLEEGKETIWVGTAEGLERFDRFNGIFRHFRHRSGSSNSLSDDYVTALVAWGSDSMWVGTRNGLNLFRRSTGTFQRYLYESGSENQTGEGSIRALYADHARNQLWIGAGHGLERMDVTSGQITHVHGDSDNTSEFSSDEIVGLYTSEARPNTLWVGTENGLNSVDLETGAIAKYEANARSPSALSHRHVTAITTLPADSNAVWVGTLAGGLNRLDLGTGKFTRFTRRNSALPGNTIYGIQPDDDGFLWIATNRGLVCFNPILPDEVRIYDVDSGVQSRQFNVGASYRTPRGEIALGGVNGFNIFSPTGFRDSPYTPKVVLTGYRVDGRPQLVAPEAIMRAEQIVLSHDQNDVAFDFVGLHFARPDRNRYRVRLDESSGDSSEWRDLGTQRTATYANLRPGRYTFYIQAANSDGVWSEVSASVQMQIRPPWWQTWWFRIFALVSTVAIAVFVYKRRIRLIAERNRELEGLVAERTGELEQQTTALESKNDQLEATLGQLRTAQTRLVQAEKLASLGRVTAGVAHEIKNPLNFVNNFAQLSEELTEELRTELASSSDRSVGDVLDELNPILGDLALNAAKIAEHGKRADGIVKSMLLHARGTSGDPEPTSLHTLLDETIDLIVHSGGGDGVPVNIERDYDERIGDVSIVRQAIGRVVLNLLENAVYAIHTYASPEADYVPTITLRTGDLGQNFQIVVEDNGPGIPEDVRVHLFEPFFTTKPTGDGTGLGLSLAHDIIHSHHGEITASSEPEQGTSFTIVLPKIVESIEGAD